LSFQKIKSLQPRDTSDVILQIRKRLFITGDLIIDSRQKTFDNELLEGVLKYKKRNGFTPDSLLLPQHIENMNITVHERIKTYGQYGTFEMAVTRLYKSEAIYSGEHSIIYANLFQGKQACTRIQSSSRESHE
jgi:hypothetical protein